MQTKLLYFSLFLLSFWATSLSGQIAYQGFEQNASDTWNATFSTPACNISGDIWDYSTGFSSLVPSVGTQFWGVQDLTGNCGAATGESITFATTNVASFTSVSISFDYDIVGFDNGDDVFYTVVLDGAAQPQVQLIDGGTGSPSGSGTGATTTGGYLTETITIPGGTSTVGFQLVVDQNGGADRAAFDNFILDGTPIASCPHSIISFAPNVGTPGTEVQINGTGFTASSTVDFNGVAAANIQFIDANTLIATVPSGAGTGIINVVESSCTESTAGNYTPILGGGTCSTSGSTFTDLVISEVFDNASGSLGYIEIYNGTNTAINLSDFQIDRYATLASTTISHSYTFPAIGTGSTIAPGQVLVGKVSTTFGGVEDFTFSGSTAGFNADDRLELVRISTGAVVDDFHDSVIGATGYIYRRNTTITGPNPNFDPTEWTTGTAGDVSELGTFINSTPITPPSITTAPSDASGCDLSFTVAATAGNAGTLTYQWYFNENDGATPNWTAVSAASFAPNTVIGETTTTLSITGDLSSYDGYQFYCEVTEDGSCYTVSDAAQYAITTDRFFRTVTSGNWTDLTTWEIASSAAGPWSPACLYPTADNSDYIHILATHNIDVNQDILIDQTVVEANGTLTILTTNQLIVNNGTGIDLEVLGTLIDNGNSGGNGINLSTNSGTWSLGANGTIIKTGSSTIAQYRDNYEGGISTIPATASWIYRHTTNSASVSVLTVNMFYPNLYLESTNGNHSFSNPSEVFQGISGFMTVKGSMFIGNTGTGAVDVFHSNVHPTPAQILGDLVIGGNGNGNTSTLNNDDNGTIGTGFEILGDLQINTNGQLILDDGTAATDGVVRLHGDWNDLNTGIGFREGQSTLELIGSTTQTINKSSTSENCYNLVINKPSGDVLNNASDWTIRNNATFTNGIVRTSATAYVLFEAAATTTGASNASHIDGPVAKETNSGVITNFTYPTGDNGIYGPIGIETRFHAGEFYIAEYINTPYADLTVNPMELDHVSRFEHWMLDELIGGTGEELRVTLHWGAHSQVLTPASLRVAHYYTEAPSTSNQWESEGNIATTGNMTIGSVTSDYVSEFSPFTLADIIRQRSLPLDIIAFTANKVNKTSVLKLEVANEKKTDRYCIQRSNDGINFETLTCFEATQDNPTVTYNYTDLTPMLGNNYYRIYQVDYLGDEYYSDLRVVNFEGQVQTRIYPNPTAQNLTIELEQNANENHTLEIIDALGRILKTDTLLKGTYLHQIAVTDLPNGTYILRMTSKNGTSSIQQFIVK
jgi:hypothetical protein